MTPESDPDARDRMSRLMWFALAPEVRWWLTASGYRRDRISFRRMARVLAVASGQLEMR
jgi:hypothetical protein